MSLVKRLTEEYFVSGEDARHYVEVMEHLSYTGGGLADEEDVFVRTGELSELVANARLENIVSKMMFNFIGAYSVEPYVEAYTGTANLFHKDGDLKIEYDEGVFRSVLESLKDNEGSMNSIWRGIEPITFSVSVYGVREEDLLPTDLALNHTFKSFLKHKYENEKNEQRFTECEEYSSHRNAAVRAEAEASRRVSALFERTFLNSRKIWTNSSLRKEYLNEKKDSQESSVDDQINSVRLKKQIARNEIARYGSSERAKKGYKRALEDRKEILEDVRETLNDTEHKALYRVRAEGLQKSIAYRQVVIDCLEEFPNEEPFIP